MYCVLSVADRVEQRPVSEDYGLGIYKYDEYILRAIALIATTVVASLLPLSSVVILYLLRSNAIRIGVITILSMLFSFAVALMTNARKIEIFAAASA